MGATYSSHTQFQKFHFDTTYKKINLIALYATRIIGNPNPVKFGRCIAELERIYGIRNGGNKKAVPQIAEVNKSQSDLTAELGMSVDTLNRYKALAQLIPEVEDFLDTGMITLPATLREYPQR